MAIPETSGWYSRIVYPLWTWKDGNYPFRHLRELERTQYLTPGEIADLQLDRIKKLVRHAYDRCPYYRDAWRKIDIHPNDIRSLRDFEKIPTVSKRDVQEHRERMRRSDIDAGSLVRNSTGGSTGEPVSFYLDRERVKSRNAATIRHDRWAGKDIGTRFAAIWGHHADLKLGAGKWWADFRQNWIYRYVVLDTSSMTAPDIERFLEVLKRTSPPVYLAYANSVYLLAMYIRNKGIRDHHRPHSIITSAEYLEADRRELIESTFECRVFDRYGCRETSVIASECGEHAGMHQNAESIYLEILGGSGAAEAGIPGQVVITDLLNYGMPLIRYRIQDVAERISEPCGCGRGLPRIRMRGGRTTDFLLTPEGKIIAGASLTIYLVAATPGIAQAQLVQETRDALSIRVVKGPGFMDEHIRGMVARARTFVGDSMRIEVEFLDSIPLTQSGKHRFCISSVDPFE